MNFRFFSPLFFGLVVSFSLLIQGCGGGGGSGTPVVNTDPIISATAISIVSVGASYSFDVSVTDPDAGDTFTFTLQNNPGWMSITKTGDRTAVITGTPLLADVGTVTGISIGVTDSSGGGDVMYFNVTVTNCVAGSASNVIISGGVTFDRVPVQLGVGLDYGSIDNTAPVRGAIVEAICNSVIDSVTTDAAGHYSLTVPGDTSGMFLRVKAQMLQTGTPSWDFQVVDNTSGQALYSMDGGIFDSGTVSSTRNLHAQSGWTGSNYGSVRVAAPFAILDSVYKIKQKILAVDANTNFPALKLNWSINNNLIAGNPAFGQIGSSYYNGTDIYILGDEDSDTDEYDEHIIVHEWGHYFEDKFSRSDSIGGFHALNDYLDMRVAFGEGFGNAFSAMMLDDPVYKDSQDALQAAVFDFNIESDNCSPKGWYSECSVQEILYDIYDSANDAADTLSLGFTPIYNVLINEQKTTSALTSIFPFVTALKTYYSDPDLTYINNLVSSHVINSASINEFGTTETNSASSANVIPIYTPISPNQTSATLCTTDDFAQVYSAPDRDNFNKLTSTRFLKFTVTAPNSSYTVTANHVSGANSPGLGLYGSNGWIKDSLGSSLDTGVLTPGVYTIESYDVQVSSSTNPAASACYTIRVEVN
ncbi:MAG: hypothetical protein OQK47_02210 [Gammaproteobacteria bacterium]|nr:hypothetical protein [Gammaproteobacteria bacterium]